MTTHDDSLSGGHLFLRCIVWLLGRSVGRSFGRSFGRVPSSSSSSSCSSASQQKDGRKQIEDDRVSPESLPEPPAKSSAMMQF